MNQTIKKVLAERQTVKAYSDKKISKEDWNTILETIYWSPTSFGYEPYRVLIINKDSEIREKIFPLMWKQGVAKEADKLVFFLALDAETFKSEKWLFQRSKRKLMDIDGLSAEDAEIGAEKTSNFVGGAIANHTSDWSIKQTYIASGMAMYSASILGIGSTPIEGFMPDAVKSLFVKEGLMKENEIVALSTAFGYPKDETAYAHFGSGKRVRDKWEDKFKEI